MSPHITIALPWPPRALNPNGRAHWRAKAKAARQVRRDACILTLAAGVRALPWQSMQVELIFCPPDRRPRDLDNMLASAKSLLDGVADATGVDDSRWGLSLTRGQPTKGGSIIVVLSEAVPAPWKSIGSLTRLAADPFISKARAAE